MVERSTENRKVTGSTPVGATSKSPKHSLRGFCFAWGEAARMRFTWGADHFSEGPCDSSTRPTRQISHVISNGHFSSTPENVAIPTINVHSLKHLQGNYVRNFWRPRDPKTPRRDLTATKRGDLRHPRLRHAGYTPPERFAWRKTPTHAQSSTRHAPYPESKMECATFTTNRTERKR